MAAPHLCSGVKLGMKHILGYARPKLYKMLPAAFEDGDGAGMLLGAFIAAM